jgi:demethylmenaquinone methyltransferase/2-methoxy-6-polyprenyl-1,4-benzoquinol methylase
MTLAPDAVRSMFDRIAPVYDAMNRVMTAGLDRRWRRLTAEAVVRPGDRVLDGACGTGDLAVADAKAGGAVTGLDFSERMLERARGKSGEIEWVQGDALALPFDDAAFDAARYAIDQTKTRAPIWKAEHFRDGKIWIGAAVQDGPRSE